MIPVFLPTLRERPDDVELLAWHFIEQNEAQAVRAVKRMTPGAVAALRSYDWPGNVRELQNAVDAVELSEPIRAYIVELARATRDRAEIEVGLSPRGSLALAHASRAQALMRGRDYVIPEDVLDNLAAVGAHRLITPEFATGGGWQAAAALLDEISRTVATPA